MIEVLLLNDFLVFYTYFGSIKELMSYYWSLNGSSSLIGDSGFLTSEISYSFTNLE